MKGLIKYWMIFLAYLCISCSAYHYSSENNNALYFYFGSGFDNEVVRIYFDDHEFIFDANSDLSIGVVLSNYFKCYDNKITMIYNNSVIDSTILSTCKTIKLRIQTNKSTFEQNILSSKGHFFIIDKNNVTNELIVTQSKRSISVE